MEKYTREYVLNYYDSDKNGQATPVILLKILAETSGWHTESIGYGHKKMEENNYTWMLSRWRVRFFSYPLAGEKITISTWTSKIDRFYANREFTIADDKGNIIAKASTLWIFIDLIKKRPIRIPTELYSYFNIIEEFNFDDFSDFKEAHEVTDFHDFSIRRYDIDYNNHVNNTVYLSWFIEAIPDNIFENYQLKEFEINYKKETKYGNIIKSGSKEIGIYNEEKIFYHTILDRDMDINHTLGLTRWGKK